LCIQTLPILSIQSNAPPSMQNRFPNKYTKNHDPLGPASSSPPESL
jgi:hypothetical protein